MAIEEPNTKDVTAHDIIDKIINTLHLCKSIVETDADTQISQIQADVNNYYQSKLKAHKVLVDREAELDRMMEEITTELGTRMQVVGTSLRDRINRMENALETLQELKQERVYAFLALKKEMESLEEILGEETVRIDEPRLTLEGFESMREEIEELKREEGARFELACELQQVLLKKAEGIWDYLDPKLREELGAILHSILDKNHMPPPWSLRTEYFTQLEGYVDQIEKVSAKLLERVKERIKEITVFWRDLGMEPQELVQDIKMLPVYEELADELRIEWKKQVLEKMDDLIAQVSELWVVCGVSQQQMDAITVQVNAGTCN